MTSEPPVNRATAWVYGGVWAIVTALFRVPRSGPSLPVGDGESVETFHPARGYLGYLRFWFCLFLIGNVSRCFSATVKPDAQEWLNYRHIDPELLERHPLYGKVAPEDLRGESVLFDLKLEHTPFHEIQIRPDHIPEASRKWKEMNAGRIVLPEHQKKTMEKGIIEEGEENNAK